MAASQGWHFSAAGLGALHNVIIIVIAEVRGCVGLPRKEGRDLCGDKIQVLVL